LRVKGLLEGVGRLVLAELHADAACTR
jgi:hypothetical protein